MAMVTHPTINETTKMYKGTALQTWNANSRLIDAIKQIETEFNQTPPQMSQ